MSGSSNAGAAARQSEMARQARITEGNELIDQRFSGFDENFYRGREQAFSDFAKPQLARQFNDAQGGLISSLSRRGLLNSSAGARQLGQLQEQRNTNLSDILSRARGHSNAARQDVQNQRLQLSGALNASADPSAAAGLAATAANALSSAPSFAPIGEVFSNLSFLPAANAANVSRGNASIFGRGNNRFSSGEESLRVVS